MDNIAGNNDGVSGLESELADVSGMLLYDLLPSDDTVLANSLRRVLTELGRSQDIIAAFANYAK